MNIFPSQLLLRRELAFLVVFLLGLFTTERHAFAMFEGVTLLNWQMAPEYCKARLSDDWRNRNGSRWHFPINEPLISKWKQQIGPAWAHMHHYCVGKALMFIAEQPSELARTRLGRETAYSLAIGEINYTRSKTEPRTTFWKLMTMDMAQANAGAGRIDEALALLTILQELHPDEAQVYVTAANIMARRNRLDEAMATLETGLKRSKDVGAVLFWLAQYTFDHGDVARATELLGKAEASGMRMDSLRERMGISSVQADTPPD